MRLFYRFCFVFFICGSVLAASTPNQGVLISVNGDVQIKVKKNRKTVIAKKDMTVFEGDRITTKDKSTATLRLFDGSELKISEKTKFVLTALQKPTEQTKIIKFKLLIGKLFAEVKKLTTSESAFEIEAGGVVCGVRGTKFSMENNGAPKPKVILQVFDGSVYAIDGKGNHYIFNPGPPIQFQGGTKSGDSGKPNDQSNDDKKKPNKTSDGGGSSDTGASTSLNDLSNQFQTGVLVNGDNTLNNPSVLGSVQVNVHPQLGY